MTTNIQATAIHINHHGVLLTGGAGCGKSDLALRMIHNGAELVADGDVSLLASGMEGKQTLMATASAMTAGQMHIHGIGMVRMPFENSAPIRCCVHLSASWHIQKYPEWRTENFLGVNIPVIELNAFEVSTPIKIKTALDIIIGEIEQMPNPNE